MGASRPSPPLAAIKLRALLSTEAPPLWLVMPSIVTLAGLGALAAHDAQLAVAVAACLGATCAVIVKPFYGVAALAALAPVLSGTKRGWLVPHLRLSEALIVWLGSLVILCARRPVRGWGRLEWLGLAYSFGTLSLGAFDLWRRGAPFSSGNVDGLVGPFQFLILLRAIRVGVRDERQVAVIARVLLLAAVPVCLMALLQGSGVGWAQHLSHAMTGVDEGHLNRATGPFTNWQVLAGYLVAVGLLAVGVVSFDANRILPRPLALLMGILIAGALARTLTIGAFAGWTAGSAVLLIAGGQVRITGRGAAVAFGAIGVLLAGVLASRYHQEFTARPGQASNGLVPNTVMDRFHNWTDQYLPALAGRWVTGYGPDIPTDVTWRFTDSVYVTLILRGGVLLLSVYALLMAGFLRVSTLLCGGTRRVLGSRQRLPWGAERCITLTHEAKGLAATLFVLTLLLAPLQFIATYFTTSGLPEVMWILGGLVSVCGPFGNLTRV